VSLASPIAMSSRPLIALAASAVSALLSSVALAATAVAELPLKTSVLAKPNVIIGMDDSGSMDWEVLLNTASGLVYWNGTSAWDSGSNAPLRDSDEVPYAYLFPIGTNTGGAIYAHNSWYGQALPPTNQFAWLRSSRFNPIYYNPMASYPAWSPAWFGGSLKTYADAPANNAPGHPAVTGTPRLNLSTNWSSANGNFTDDGYRFYVQSGMVLPAGTVVRSTGTGAGGNTCSGGTVTLTGAQTVPNNRACWASIPYYPATYWHPQACTVGPDCVAAPDGSGTLQRYEIRPGTTSYPSGRNYAQEMQNFANWFSYYRKRKLMLAGSMGRVLENISGLRLAVVPFNENPTVTMFDADGASAASNRLAAAGAFYLNSMEANGTPTHQTVKNIAAQFATNSAVIQYACQRNNMFIVTDGFSNTTSTSVPAYNAALWGASSPYTWTPTGSLADLALSYYTNRLRTDLPAGRVPVSASTAPNADRNPDLHINTYAITLGVRGSLWPNTADPYVTAPAWTAPTANNPSMIDDQWHATINGRGRMYLATTPEETVTNIRAGLEDMLSQRSTQGAISVSTVNLARGDSRAYQAIYNPSGWTGDVEAISVDPTSGVMGSSAIWSASSLLTARDWTTRVIASHNGSAGVAFTAAAVGTLVNPGGTFGNTADVMAYLRGDRSREGSTFKTRQGLIGAVIQAEPAVDRETGVVYAASGEGMLHAFDTQGADAGKELWAYVPRAVLPDIGQTTQRNYAFKTQLDGSPVIRKIGGGSKLLVAGMGAAGRGYYALDVSAPRGLNETTLASKALWEFPSAGDSLMQSKMGMTMGKPAIVRLGSGQHVVVVTSGYNNTLDGKARVWVLNAATGAVMKEFVTPDGSLASEAGLAHVAPFAESDGSVRYVYGGDLLGNVWRFDLNAASLSAAAVTKLAQLRGPTGVAQPVTTAPELLMHQGKRIVYVGTGRMLDISDFGSNLVQSVYAIADGSTLANARSSLVQQILNTAGTGTLTSNPLDWATQRGWYVDLPAGEQVNTRPVMAYGALTLVVNRAGSSDCSASSRMIVIDVLSGSKYAGSDFVSWTISTTSNATAPVAVLTADTGKVKAITREYEQARSRDKEVANAIPVPPGKNAWREVRR
jgi:type IV pilus assembly protein PilY1